MPLALLEESAPMLDATTTAIALGVLIAWMFSHGSMILRHRKQLEELHQRLGKLERRQDD